MAKFAITVANTFKSNTNAIIIKAYKEPAEEEVILQPNESKDYTLEEEEVILQPNESKDYTLEEYDSLTISILSIQKKKHKHGSCYIRLHSIGEARFVFEGQVNITIIHELDVQKMRILSIPDRWELTVKTAIIKLGETEPPPVNVTVGDEGP